MRRRARRSRLDKLAARSELDLASLVRDLSSPGYDPGRIRSELSALAKALSVPPGKLRPDDVVEDLAGRDFFAGDALLEIEVRLQKALPDRSPQRKLTVSDVVRQLSR